MQEGIYFQNILYVVGISMELWITSCSVFVIKYDPLLFQALTSYVASRGFRKKDCEMVINFPRRVLSDMDGTIAVKDLGLHRQETVFVQFR
jgi:hypothetical protein